MSDVTLHNGGSVVGFTPTSTAAQDWFQQYVLSEDWQWLGSTLWVDQRLARDLIDEIVNSDLTVST